MQSETLIRILETEPNRVGDLFGRLMVDLFVALGYEKARLNIHKSGRELDLDATHRLERRRTIAECKATAEQIGGGDLNKFVARSTRNPRTAFPSAGILSRCRVSKKQRLSKRKHVRQGSQPSPDRRSLMS